MTDFQRGETLWARGPGGVFSFSFHSAIRRKQAIVRGHRHDNSLPIARPLCLVAKDPLDLLTPDERAEYPLLDGREYGGEG